MMKTADIRRVLADMYMRKEFVGDTVEIDGCQFEADEPTIFGTVNDAYVTAELEWYHSQSLDVNDLVPTPKIWKDIAADDGTINSNYGWCIFSPENHEQFVRAIGHLRDNPHSRHGVMIYTRPEMHLDAFENGRYDFMCTNTVQLLIRNGKLDMYVNMRSSDAVFGYKNDRAWHAHVMRLALHNLVPVYPWLDAGRIIWNAVSFHVYERHFKLIEEWDEEQWGAAV